MSEQFAQVGDVELCYETFGDPGDPALLLAMGLGTQMLAWHEDLCREFVARGFQVIRYDNRDCGRSTWFENVPPPRPGEIIRRRPRQVAYTLDDMADDAAGLLDHLGIGSAHVMGASMGGMIAQMLAANHPDRVLSLTSIMSSTGSRFTGQPHPRVLPLLLRKPARSKEEYVRSLTGMFRVIGSPGFEHDWDELRRFLEQGYERGVTAAGTGRQMAAILASGNRTPALRRITAPTLVIHGSADKLVLPSGGKATARAFPGARLLMIRGMGHDMPRAAWPQMVDAIVENTRRAPVPVG